MRVSVLPIQKVLGTINGRGVQNNMLLIKCLLLCLVFVVIPVECQYIGADCSADNRPGTCESLSQCRPLLNEIRRVGLPIPSYMKEKLQRLGCGFDNNQPLVCCESSSDTPKPFTSRPTNPWGTNSNANDGQDNSGGGSASDVRNHRNLALLPIECGAIEGDRIIGGNRTKLFEMPWMVLLAYDSARGTKLSCGGTLINRWYVLTAAHCISFLGDRLKLRAVILGEHDIRRDPDCERNGGQLSCAPKIRTVSIGSVIPHPGYSPQRLVDDIGLIRLAEPADLSLDNMKPICLPTSPSLQAERLEGLKGVVAGWGATEDGVQSPVLLSVDLPIIPNTECNEIYNGSPRVHNSQLCAGGIPDKDSCGGDSGGPILYHGKTRAIGVRYVQRGIVSYGSRRCGVGGFPGVYTRVANYMDWILDNIRP